MAHQNGTVEDQCGHPKRAADQVPPLRGSVDFDSLDVCRAWIAKLVDHRNTRAMVHLACAALRPLLP